MTLTSLAIILSMVTVVAASGGSAGGEANRAQPPNSLCSPPKSWHSWGLNVSVLAQN